VAVHLKKYVRITTQARKKTRKIKQQQTQLWLYLLRERQFRREPGSTTLSLQPDAIQRQQAMELDVAALKLCEQETTKRNTRAHE
jgi:hypothetical protein